MPLLTAVSSLLCKVKHMKVSLLFLLMLSLCDTTCSSIHLPPHSLHSGSCTVLQARSESCCFSRYPSRTGRVNWHLHSWISVSALTTLPRLDWCWVENTGTASPLGWPVVGMKFPTAVEHRQESLLWAGGRTLPSWHEILQADICIQNSSCSPVEPYKRQSLVCG